MTTNVARLQQTSMLFFSNLSQAEDRRREAEDGRVGAFIYVD